MQIHVSGVTLLFLLCITTCLAFTSTEYVYQGEWYLDIVPEGIPLSAFNWDFLFAEQGVWTVAHVVNPYMLTMFTQDSWGVFTMVLFFEVIEAIFLLVAGSTRAIFANDDASDYAESSTESLVGDVFQGVLGILLARLVILVYKVPSWTPSVFSPYRDIWVKRFLQLALLELCFAIINGAVRPVDSPPWRYGLEIALVWFVFVWWLMMRLNWTPREISLFWRLSGRAHYELCYNAWFITAIVLLGSCLFFVTYPYFQIWIVYTFIVGWHLVTLALQNRFSELWYYLDFGPQKKAYYYGQRAAVQ